MPTNDPEPHVATERRRWTLSPHPRMPVPVVRSLDVAVAFRLDGGLSLDYLLGAELAALRVPTGVLPARRDGLWRHTCFEAFLAPDAGTRYREFNFSPAGDWAAYDFQAPRTGMTVPELSRAPCIEVGVREDALRVAVSIAAEDLGFSGTLRVGLTAVVEDASGALSYFALAHPGAAPDFHDPAGFALRLPDAGGAR